MEVGQPSNMKIGAIIQARMKSTRLPGKILLPLPFGSEETLLSWPIKSLRNSKRITDIILATSENSENQLLKKFAKKNYIHFFQGSEENVLKRFTDVIKIHNLDVVVRITADNPIIDVHLIDSIIDLHIQQNFDYTYSSNLPIGMNIEVIKASALLNIFNSAQLTKADEEHVTLYFKRTQEYKIHNTSFEFGNLKNLRLTVDYPADYSLLNIVTQISLNTNLLGIELVKHINETYAWVFDINEHLYQKKQYSSLEEELIDSLKMLKICEFNFTSKILNEKI